MTDKEYEQKKRECWEALHKELLKDEVQWEPVSRKEVFNFTFDRAYALGKQEKNLPDEGTDCTPDELNEDNFAKSEPKPAEPKFKYDIGQKVKSAYADEILTIKEHCGRVGHDNVYKVEEYAYSWNECELRPYTEPKDLNKSPKACTDDCPSQSKSQDFDNILKDSFSKECRLHIAAMAMAGLLANPNNNAYISETVAGAVQCAHALIAKFEKGGVAE